MPLINYNSQNFGTHYGQDFQGVNTLNVSWADIIWASITVGKIDRNSLLQFGIHSYFDTINRITQIYANLIENELYNIEKSDLYNNLDPSEKSGVSYHLGLTITKLFFSELLDVPWLSHLDTYKTVTGSNIRLINKSKPDLLGLDRNRRWVVSEAKGRTCNFESDLNIKGKQQTNQLRNINGAFPNLRVATITYFQNNVLNFYWEDPDDMYEGEDHEISLQDYLDAYYLPFKLFFKNVEYQTIQNDNYTLLVYDFTDYDLRIGIDDRLIKNDMNFNFIFDLKYPQSSMKREGVTRKRNELIGNDGIFIKLGDKWRSENLSKQPINRN